ncbi:MAG: hypothetical protein CMJ34_01070 [Phycisphaerae bacterium]|nr:hypothetical protein [Phycisphaerae bacterium]
MDSKKTRPLAFDYDQSAMVWVIPLMILAALTFNITALTMPFLEIKIGLAPVENYSIPHTVHLMWFEFKVYLIAVLVAGFSLVFPFVKLLLLICGWYLPLTEHRRGRVLSVLGALGRWSLLDVFVALVLIVLAHDQGRLFVTGVKPGLALFLAAIIIAMITGDIMHRLHDRTSVDQPVPRRAKQLSPLMTWGVPVLALAALGTLVASLQAPYLKITAWFLDRTEYSILGTIQALIEESDFIFGFAVAMFLVIMPSLRVLLIGGAWWWRGDPLKLFRISGVLRVVERWAMLDVFALAIGLFLLEGGNLVPIEHRSGVWLLLAAVVSTVVLSKVAGSLILWSSTERPADGQNGGAAPMDVSKPS